MTQSEVFSTDEGTAWLKRNEKRIPIKNDLVLRALNQLVGGLSNDAAVLEIGCSNGWRLREIKKRYGCAKLAGIEPSQDAVEMAKKGGIIKAVQGYANVLPFKNNEFDVVIYGFCLYLCDRHLLFEIASEGNRVLTNGGLMIVYDFDTPHPCKNKYKYKKGVWSYKQSYDNMFLWNPVYSKILSVYHRDGQTKATIMRKNQARGWPEC